MSTSTWNVLVIEDEYDSMELVQGILEFHGIASVGASSAEEALEVVETVTPTLMIIDLALPGMDGWSLLNRLLNTPRLKTIPKIAITAYHTPMLANQAIEAGFDAYFAKPIDATSFVRELQTIVEN